MEPAFLLWHLAKFVTHSLVGKSTLSQGIFYMHFFPTAFDIRGGGGGGGVQSANGFTGLVPSSERSTE